MSFLASLLRGERIADVYVDSEVTYVMLESGTQVTIRGSVIVEPALSKAQAKPPVPRETKQLP